MTTKAKRGRKWNVKFKVGDKVIDTWWPYNGSGKVVAVGKTRIRIEWVGGNVSSYDMAHARFLARERGGR